MKADKIKVASSLIINDSIRIYIKDNIEITLLNDDITINGKLINIDDKGIVVVWGDNIESYIYIKDIETITKEIDL